MKKGLNATTLKTIAIIAMVIDHISWGFFDFYSIQGYMLHIIGRLTIPIMCFFIAEGFKKTHNLKRYILRMTVFAIITIIPFYLFFHEEYGYRQNIIFDYLLALLMLTVCESKKFGLPIKILLASALVITSMLIGGWPVMPILYVLIFYYADSFKKQAALFSGATIVLVLFMMLGISLNTKYNFLPMYSQWVWWDKSYFLGFILALFLLRKYNGEKGKCLFGRYFYFIFYPAHFLVLYAIKMIISTFGSYGVYIGFQVFCICLLTFFIAYVLLVKSSKAQSSTILFCVCTLVYEVAFLIETTAKSLDVASTAVTFEYVGEAGAFMGLTIFLAEFCHFRVHKAFYILEGIIYSLSVVLVHTARNNRFFYKSMSMDFSGEFPRLVLEYGYGFYGFIIVVALYFMFFAYMMLKAYPGASEIEQKRLKHLLFGLTCPWLAVIIRKMGLTGGYEISFVGLIFSEVEVMVALLRYGYFDSVQLAVTNVIYKSNEGLLVMDTQKNILYFNSVVDDIFPGIAQMQHISKVPKLQTCLEKCFDDNGNLIEAYSANIIQANDKIYEVKTEPILESGYIQGYMARVVDYTSHYHRLEELRKSAHIDALTGLFDRELFKQEITEYLSNGGVGALYMLDVDYFKEINDNFGHMVGDDVLVSLSETIRAVFTDKNLYSRIGGDEFMIFVKGTQDREALSTYAKRLQEAYKKNVTDIDENLFSSISIGIAVSTMISSDTDGKDAFEALYSLADKALYYVKNKDKDGFSFYKGVSD